MESLYAWSELTSATINSLADVINQIIWNIKNIIMQESIFNEPLFSLGVVKIRELISETGTFSKA